MKKLHHTKKTNLAFLLIFCTDLDRQLAMEWLIDGTI